MLVSFLRWSCVVLPLLVAADCKPPRPYRPRVKLAKSAAHPPPLALPAVVPAPALASPQPNHEPPPSNKLQSALQRREACVFKKGAMPEQTLDAGEPIGQR